MRRTTVRVLACLLGLGVAAGLYTLGRASAGRHPDPKAEYARGLDAGRAQGMREGRESQEVGALAPGVRDGAKAAFDDGYKAGANDVFTGYDGGWAYSTPYLVTLARGGTGITYRFASRTPLRAGTGYFLCPHAPGWCEQPRVSR
ncbi:hypothetical protein FB559_4671 [Actinoallomurus bryophytorum]|uniref:Uncharacterized protein n=1 Tax=Actinoallomurus bryophytorum TaxID=1490222 RepID=A0A543CPI4_9ACTN|nr:hypothetical protein [Actinoallomurus bryophytorum]TQL99018.1 hypothetical protein FB559_4671 [Actinoallomurus bryophytorum]